MANVPCPLLNFRRYVSLLVYTPCLNDNGWHKYTLFSCLIEPIIKSHWRTSSEKLFSSRTRTPLFINMYLSLLFLLNIVHNWLHSQLISKPRKRHQNKWLGKFKDGISVVKFLTQVKMLAVFKSMLPVKEWFLCSPLSSAKCVKYLPACISSLFLQYLQSGKSSGTWLLILNTRKGSVST